MKHTELTDHIQGSILKQQYLEAFLVQAAYIESLLKMHADFSYWVETNEMKDSEILDALRKEISNYSLFKLIEFLRKTKLIKNELAQDLHNYRDKRNRVVHDLLSEIYNDSFSHELKVVCNLGEKIIVSEEFNDILDIVKSRDTSIRDLSPSTSPSGSKSTANKTSPSRQLGSNPVPKPQP